MIDALKPHVTHGWVEATHPPLSAKYTDTHAYMVCPCNWKGTVRYTLLEQLGHKI